MLHRTFRETMRNEIQRWLVPQKKLGRAAESGFVPKNIFPFVLPCRVDVETGFLRGTLVMETWFICPFLQCQRISYSSSKSEIQIYATELPIKKVPGFGNAGLRPEVVMNSFAVNDVINAYDFILNFFLPIFFCNVISTA
ncbi:unnamed protein product [Clavelina lepadiformis]|uniref:Uncharacterized protein n=1 Tax=Clavelina lepadiformis TaxID=159417 RepID=A0ABP0FXB7_CLALP